MRAGELAMFQTFSPQRFPSARITETQSDRRFPRILLRVSAALWFVFAGLVVAAAGQTGTSTSAASCRTSPGARFPASR